MPSSAFFYAVTVARYACTQVNHLIRNRPAKAQPLLMRRHIFRLFQPLYSPRAREAAGDAGDAVGDILRLNQRAARQNKARGVGGTACRR